MNETTDGHDADGHATGDHATSDHATGDHAADGHDCPACDRRFPDEDVLRDHLYSVGLVY